MKPDVVRTIPDLRTVVAGWRGAGLSVGMVPTMGALHEGHLALVREAQRQTDRVVVTLFVNPAQFAPTEDLAAYPRTEESDREKLAEVGADLLFAPFTADMYPPSFETKINVGGPAAGLETDFRPHFFTGVATIVAKLLLAGFPDKAFFGEKDYQQLLVVKKLVRDLNFPTEIVGCPTIRAADGLALSSRNVYLDADQQATAPKLYDTLRAVAKALRSGTPVESALEAGREDLTRAGFVLDYLELRNAETLDPVKEIGSGPVRLLAAARLRATRLIDNISV